jgi:ABC-type cobalt transport system substrate-binding protein
LGAFVLLVLALIILLAGFAREGEFGGDEDDSEDK